MGVLFVFLAGFVTISFDAVTYGVIERDMMVNVCVSLSAAYLESVSVSLIPKAIAGGVYLWFVVRTYVVCGVWGGGVCLTLVSRCTLHTAHTLLSQTQP